jgi:hypothetical protein
VPFTWDINLRSLANGEVINERKDARADNVCHHKRHYTDLGRIGAIHSGMAFLDNIGGI